MWLIICTAAKVSEVEVNPELYVTIKREMYGT